MKQVVWMAAGSLGGWLVAAAVTGFSSEVFLGMAGPLVAAAATWLLVERTQRQDPSKVTRALMTAFAAKMLFFGVYVVAVSRVPQLNLAAFGAAFLVYFVVLYVVQAFLLRGLTVPQAS
jgi:uncharacterized membrane protein YozB (DUF420 family)